MLDARPVELEIGGADAIPVRARDPGRHAPVHRARAPRAAGWSEPPCQPSPPQTNRNLRPVVGPVRRCGQARASAARAPRARLSKPAGNHRPAACILPSAHVVIRRRHRPQASAREHERARSRTRATAIAAVSRQLKSVGPCRVPATARLGSRAGSSGGEGTSGLLAQLIGRRWHERAPRTAHRAAKARAGSSRSSSGGEGTSGPRAAHGAGDGEARAVSRRGSQSAKARAVS